LKEGGHAGPYKAKKEAHTHLGMRRAPRSELKKEFPGVKILLATSMFELTYIRRARAGGIVINDNG
jgi:hypothetical protein